jgi:stage IV sporulation protein FB
LAAKFCDGDADEVILWPLGGLALCRPLFNPMAHFLTAVGGPFVTLVLFLLFGGLFYSEVFVRLDWIYAHVMMYWLMETNKWLLLFNMIPAFPMDGGRILRDLLWFKMGVNRATKIAVPISQVIAGGGVIFGLVTRDLQLAILSCFIFYTASYEYEALEWETLAKPFSIKERLKRFGRKRAFEATLFFIF